MSILDEFELWIGRWLLTQQISPTFLDNVQKAVAGLQPQYSAWRVVATLYSHYLLRLTLTSSHHDYILEVSIG